MKQNKFHDNLEVKKDYYSKIIKFAGEIGVMSSSELKN